MGAWGGCVLATGLLIKADKTLKREEEPLKVQDRKMEKRADFFFFIIICLKIARRKLGGEEGIHITEDQFSI